MSSQVVFLTLFLGLLAGPHVVEMQVGPAVTSVRRLDNRLRMNGSRAANRKAAEAAAFQSES